MRCSGEKIEAQLDPAAHAVKRQAPGTVFEERELLLDLALVLLLHEERELLMKERELLLDLALVLLLLHDLPVQLLTLLAEVLDALDLAVRALAKCCRVLGCLVQTLVLCSMPFTMCCEVLSFFCKVVLTGPDALDLAVRAKLHLANSEVFPLHLELPASAAKSLPTSGT